MILLAIPSLEVNIEGECYISNCISLNTKLFIRLLIEKAYMNIWSTSLVVRMFGCWLINDLSCSVRHSDTQAMRYFWSISDANRSKCLALFRAKANRLYHCTFCLVEKCYGVYQFYARFVAEKFCMNKSGWRHALWLTRFLFVKKTLDNDAS